MQSSGTRFKDLNVWWTRGILAASAAFVGWFIIVEREGLGALFTFLWDGIVVIPDSIGKIIEYYGALPADQLLPSLVFGAIFGVLTTTVVLFRSAGVLPGPYVTQMAAVAGLVVAFVLYLIGMTALNAAFLGLLVAIVISIGQLSHLRDGLCALANPIQLREVVGGRARWLLLVSLGVGLGGGLLGSQVLVYATQHCTYAGGIPSAQQQIGVLITLAGVLIVLLPVWTVLLRRQGTTNRATSGFFRGQVLPLVFLIPALLSLLVFLYYPAIEVVLRSLKRQQFPLPQERFICLENYVSLAENTIYRTSFGVTFIITALVVVMAMSLALSIAVLASQKVRGASIYRTLLIWPYALSPVVTGVIFLTMFREGRSGLINYGLFETFGLTPSWLTDPYLAIFTVVFASVWNILGFNILFYIAGLQNVPRDLLEAAQIDGANRLQRFWSITLPMLSPFTFFLLVTNVTYSFYGIYGVIDTMTQGRPPLGTGGEYGGATNVLIYKLYEDAFGSGAPAGSAAAQAVVLFLLVAGITLFQFRYLETRVTYAE